MKLVIVARFLQDKKQLLFLSMFYQLSTIDFTFEIPKSFEPRKDMVKIEY